jgi:folate-binding protein YgfZ
LAVIAHGETTWLIVEGPAAPALAGFLDRMRFLLRVTVEDRTADLAVLGALAPLDLPAASPAGVPLVWTDPWATGAPGGATAARGPHPGAEWTLRLVLVPRDALPAVADRVRAGEPHAAGVLALEALRIAAWRPRAAAEVDARTLPHELDWLRSAVHLTKGCYRGQETVAKVHNLGRPPRRLVQLDLDGSESLVVRPGDLVRAEDGRPAGAVTSAAVHHELGPVALAVVKRAVPEDLPLVVETADGPVAAAQQVIVPADTGPAVAVPRIPRLGRAV